MNRWMTVGFVAVSALLSCGKSTRDFGVATDMGGTGGATSGGATSGGGLHNTVGGNPVRGGNGGTANSDAGMAGAADTAGTAGTTESDLCSGEVCDTPPPGSCESGTQFKSYDKMGTCKAGVCDYASHLIACTCTGNACKNDPCATVTCTSPDQCHMGPGVCDPTTAACSYPNKANGSPCSNIDANACTADTCVAGTCTSGAVKACPAPAACHTAGQCSAATGTCSTPSAMDHTSCGTNVECLSGACQCTTTSCPNGCCTAAGACGVCTPTTLATRTIAVGSVTVDASFLYFAETDSGGDSSVYSLPKTGGQAQFLSLPQPSHTIDFIVADGSYIYGGASFQPAARMPILGGSFTDIPGSAGSVDAIRTNTSRVVVGTSLSNNYIFSFPKTGGTAITNVASPNIDYHHFAVDDSFVYVISGGTAVSRIPAAGTDSTSVTSAGSGEIINDISLSGTQLLLATSTRVAKVAAAGGTPVTLDTGSAYTVVGDANAVFYFRTKGTGGACTGGSELYTVPLAGGTVRRLAVESSATCVRSVVQDASAVYWLTGNVIKKAAK